MMERTDQLAKHSIYHDGVHCKENEQSQIARAVKVVLALAAKLWLVGHAQLHKCPKF